MIKLRLTLDPREVAAALAHETDHEQAAFLQTFLSELRKACGTHFATETQLCYIANQLSPQDRETLAILGPEERPHG